jgi:hypothetical protein
VTDDWVAGAADEVRARARELAMARAVERLADELTEQLFAAAREATPPPPPRPAAAQGTVLWCYGVTDGAVPDTAGVDGAPVRALEHAGLTALVSEVPAARFSSGALEAELEDMGRLEALARAHENVLGAALEAGPVVPFRLCTIYSDADAVRASLAGQQVALADALRAVTGMAEWSVKVLHRPGAASAAATAGGASGADYLARKREAREQAAATADAAADVAGRVHERLTAQAADAVLAHAQDRRLSGHEGEMVLNAAYLVPDDRAEAFRAAVEELAQRYESEDLHFQLAGPWPAHHFSTPAAA